MCLPSVPVLLLVVHVMQGGALSSKERKSVLGRITDHKGRIKLLLQKYECIRAQGISSRAGAGYDGLTVENVLAGDFPWTFRNVLDATGEHSSAGEAQSVAQRRLRSEDSRAPLRQSQRFVLTLPVGSASFLLARPWCWDIGVHDAGVRGFKDKLTYWAAYNGLLRAREHKAKILQDAHSFLKYCELQQQFLCSCSDTSFALDPWLSRPIQQDVMSGLEALRRRGVRRAEQQIEAGKAVIAKMTQG